MKAASVYAKLGWFVVPLHDVSSGECSCLPREDGEPCRTQGKHPRVKKWEEEATADLAQLAAWAKHWPRANIGIAAGKSGFFAFDIDPDKGGDLTLAALIAEHGELPRTVEQRTGSGGTHYLFQMPEGLDLRNTGGRLGKGLDTRGAGGQIVVAPSVSSKGTYRWVNAPWDTEIAEAPEWLLELLKRPKIAEHSEPSIVTVWPAASPEELEQARDALKALGQAVSGEGGGLKAVQAAALLTHDFALSDLEAWDLLVEWNEENQPPYSLDERTGEDSLWVRLERGRKYGQAPYGCKRTLAANQTIEALIAEWNAGPRGSETMFKMVEKCRPLFAVIADPTRHAVAEASLVAATGVSARKLDLPPPTLPRDDAPEGSITVTPALHEAADEATKAINKHVFARNGVLCEVIRADKRTFISDLETSRVLDLMSKSAKWVRADKEGMVVIPPPIPVAQILHARRSHQRIRPIEAVTTAPVFLADGSILQDRGYNAEARLFLEPSVSVDVLDEPTREDARAAIRKFRALVSDFPFAGPADFSAWLAGVLSPLVKAATGNAPAPLICVSAAVAASGKTKLTTIASIIVTGQDAEIRPYNPRDPGEWGKRLTAFVKAASPVSVFDNVNGAFGDEGIDRLITSSQWSDRILGASDAPPLPNVTTWWATGNNIAPEGDTVRRVLVVRLDTKLERPQERDDLKIADIEQHTRDNRGELLSAALTILRAYHCAGRPAVTLPAWGSFTSWSSLVRASLVWCGLVDPFLTQRRASEELNEDDNNAHDFWLAVVEGSDGAASTLVAAANARGAHEVIGARELTAFNLKKFIGKYVDKPRAGRRIRKRLHEGLVTYRVEKLA